MSKIRICILLSIAVVTPWLSDVSKIMALGYYLLATVTIVILKCMEYRRLNEDKKIKSLIWDIVFDIALISVALFFIYKWVR